MGHFIIGTAGHIDHGKTSLVKALTGIDTDRLKEEKDRGITIDLGFAYWKDNITIIDVPGHERFIRNMVAGVSAIDFVMLVVAADDGIMPQTEEHLEILKLLHISSGVVVITKADLAERSQLSKLENEIKNFVSDSFLKDASVFRVSSVQNTGIVELSRYLQEAAKQPLPKPDHGFFRMNIDRSFSIKGFGTVLTGTVLSGTARIDQSLELFPERKIIRIRGLQKHSHSVEEVRIGDRAAINVTGIDKETIKRGNVLVEPDHLAPKNSFVVKMYILKSIKKPVGKSIRVRLHIGTSELFAKLLSIGEPILAGSSGYAKIVTEEPIICTRSDRFIVREINSSRTIGGGIVLDHQDSGSKPDVHYLSDMENDRLPFTLRRYIAYHKTLSVEDIVSVFGFSYSIIESELTDLEKLKQIIILGGRKKTVIDIGYLSFLQNDLVSTIEKFHKEYPAEKGIKLSELRMNFSVIVQDALFHYVLNGMIGKGVLSEENETVYVSTHRIQLSAKDQKMIEEIEIKLTQNRFSPPSMEIIGAELNLTATDLRRLLKIMQQLKKIVKTGENLYFHADTVREARQFVIDFIAEKGHIKITDFKDRYHTSRKFALSLLEYFDTIQVTSRYGDSRLLHHP